MANGKVIYPTGAAEQVTYVFPKNYDFQPTYSHAELDDNTRTLDGTLNSYAGAQKKTFEITFTRALKTQYDYFVDLWKFQCPLDLYMDGINLDASVKIMNPIMGRPEAAFKNPGEPTWTFTVEMEEV